MESLKTMAKNKQETKQPQVDIIRAGEVAHALKTEAPGCLELADKYRARNNGQLSPGAQREYERYVARNR
jgi:hypothetical protein